MESRIRVVENFRPPRLLYPNLSNICIPLISWQDFGNSEGLRIIREHVKLNCNFKRVWLGGLDQKTFHWGGGV